MCDLHQLIIGAGNLRRESTVRNRLNLLDLLTDHDRIVDDHLARHLLSQITEFLQHLFRRSEVERRLLICIVKPFSLQNDLSIDAVFRVHEMDIAGRDHRLVILFSQLYDPAVDILQRLHVRHRMIAYHELIVAERLNLQIVIIIDQILDDLRTIVIQYRLIEFTRFTGRSQKQSLPQAIQLRLGNPRHPVEILQMRDGNELIQIPESGQILYQNDGVMRPETLHIHSRHNKRIDVRKLLHVLLRKLQEAALEDLRRRPGIIHGPVVVLQRDSQVFTNCIQRVSLELIVQAPGQRQRIHHRKRKIS